MNVYNTEKTQLRISAFSNPLLSFQRNLRYVFITISFIVSTWNQILQKLFYLTQWNFMMGMSSISFNPPLFQKLSQLIFLWNTPCFILHTERIHGNMVDNVTKVYFDKIFRLVIMIPLSLIVHIPKCFCSGFLKCLKAEIAEFGILTVFIFVLDLSTCLQKRWMEMFQHKLRCPFCFTTKTMT